MLWIPIEQCQPIGTPVDIILADLYRYVLGIRQDGELAVSIHVNFLTDEQAFRFVVWWMGRRSTICRSRPFNGSITMISFISLERR